MYNTTRNMAFPNASTTQFENLKETSGGYLKLLHSEYDCLHNASSAQSMATRTHKTTDETHKRDKGTSFKPVDWALKLLLRIIFILAAVLLQRR